MTFYRKWRILAAAAVTVAHTHTPVDDTWTDKFKQRVLGIPARTQAVKIFDVEQVGKKRELVPMIPTISKIFNNENIKDKRLIFYVIVGGFRLGKSTMCNMICDHLEKSESDPSGKKITKSENSDKIPNIFGTKKGTGAMTEGIWITEDPYIRQLSDGQSAAIFVVDCQGVDDITSAENNELIDSQIMMLGSLMSSHLIYNLLRRYQNHNKKSLEGMNDANISLQKTLDKNNDSDDVPLKPLQKLTILIRDWEGESFGESSGNKYMLEIEKLNLNETTILDTIYTQRNCVVLPEPNDEVRKLRSGELDLKVQDVCWNNYGTDFVTHAQDFLNNLIVLDADSVKKVHGGTSTISSEAFGQILIEWYETIKKGDYKAIHSGYTFQVHNYNEDLAKKCIAQLKSQLHKLLAENLENFSIHNCDSIMAEVKSKGDEFVEETKSKFKAACKENGLGFNGNHGDRLELSCPLASNNALDLIQIFKSAAETYVFEMMKYVEIAAPDIAQQFATGEANENHLKFQSVGLEQIQASTTAHKNGDEFKLLADKYFRSYTQKCFGPLEKKVNSLARSIAEYKREMADEYQKLWFYQKICTYSVKKIDERLYKKLDEKYKRVLNGSSFLEKEIRFEAYKEFMKKTDVEYERKSEVPAFNENAITIATGVIGAGLFTAIGSDYIGWVCLGGAVAFKAWNVFTSRSEKDRKS